MSITWKISYAVCIALLLGLSGCGQSTGSSNGDGNVLVSWVPPTQNTDGSTLDDLAGYRIYYGSSPGNYDNTITISKGLTSYMVESLGRSDWYFVVTAFNSAGIESAYSVEQYAAVR